MILGDLAGLQERADVPQRSAADRQWLGGVALQAGGWHTADDAVDVPLVVIDQVMLQRLIERRSARERSSGQDPLLEEAIPAL